MDALIIIIRVRTILCLSSLAGRIHRAEVPQAYRLLVVSVLLLHNRLSLLVKMAAPLMTCLLRGAINSLHFYATNEPD